MILREQRMELFVLYAKKILIIYFSVQVLIIMIVLLSLDQRLALQYMLTVKNIAKVAKQFLIILRKIHLLFGHVIVQQQNIEIILQVIVLATLLMA